MFWYLLQNHTIKNGIEDAVQTGYVNLLGVKAMENSIVVTVNDYHRLMGIIELMSLKMKTPQIVNRLLDNLSVAKMLSQERIDGKVITMNSRVKLKDLTSKRETEVTITYPQDAHPAERRISVFSEIGLALLGRQEGDTVSWKIPNGVGLFEIIKVTYQPEAAGDYYL